MVNIKVAVRIRPISTRESKNSGSSVIVYTEQNKISLTNLKVPLNKAGDSRERTRKYGFHYCFDSSDPRSKSYADQAKIYKILGKSLLDDLFAGYNSCLLAYGQTASGKTYTMMGTEDEPGLTPRLCQGIFARIDEEKDKGNIFDVSVSYLEIYNERVRDLLEPSSNSYRTLKVREHPRLGPYVQGLTHRVACTLERLMSYVEEGTRARRTASTKQNANSSRSHALLTVFLSPKTTKTVRLIGESVEGEKAAKGHEDVASTSRRNLDFVPHYGSKLHLVDLAGSETAQNCGGVHRLKEGANINKSLVALGNVISALTGKTSTFASTNKRYIPYRDSSLTWLLKDALGGNATTIMLATISPASRNYNETAHTLRFAQRAHSVVNKPVVNEDPMEKTIRELKAEIAWLKSLLVEKNIALDTKSLSYREQHEPTNNDSTRRMTRTVENDMSRTKRAILRSVDDGILPTIRRMNSSENVATRNSDLVNSTIRKYGSYECLDGKNPTLRTGYSYNRAEISELAYEEKELVGEINEAVFVDIPTLVAVLIKPDNTFDENNSSTQIEEICSEEIQEYQIEQDFIAESDGCDAQRGIVATSRPRRDKLENDDYEQEESHFDSVCSNTVDTIGPCNEANDANDANDPCDPCNIIDSITGKEKSKFHQQSSVDATTPIKGSTNLYTLSRRFGSAEILEKKRDHLTTLERSHTSLEKQAAVPEETDDRYNEDSKNSSYASLWKDVNKSDSRNHLQRTGSNESDKTIKDNSSMLGTNKIRNNAARKPSLESLKRKTSKDSSSSSSKDEQILFSNLASERTIKRKDSLDHNAFTRTHTPVQRVKRAEIVAAVTERLYSSRKQVEETVTGVTGSMHTSTTLVSSTSASSTSGVRSPPEGTDVRPTTTNSPFTTKTKLQEISRKMLAKRRRVNADTQTEQMQTIRMKDSSSSTDETKILCQDVGILTDEHNVQRTKIDHRLPILRVKEIATLTDKLKTNITESKDAECLVNDLNFYEYGVHFLDQKEPSENSGYYTANKMCNTDSLELCLTSSDKVDRFDKSTNTTTMLPVEPNPIVQLQPRPVAEENKKPSQYFGENCSVVRNLKDSNSSIEKPERNVISMSLPDAISITIETTNFVESKVVLIEDTIEETKISSSKRDRHRLKNSESQTEKQNIERTDKDSNLYMGGFSTKTSVNQTDNKCFRIENIFKDPRNLSGVRTEKVLTMPSEKRALKASVTFTNSLGTCFVPETKECATGMDKGQVLGREWSVGKSGDESEEMLKRDTRSYVQSERTSSRDRNIEDTFRRSVDVWKNWIISFPPTSWQRSRNLLSPVGVEPWTFAWNGTLMPSENECTAIVSNTNLRRSPKETAPNSSDLFFSNDLYDKDQASDSLKSPSLINRINTKGIVEQDYNFSDDSLDYNEENVLSSNTNNNKIEIPEEEEGFENICPPDVVAHTKRESSVLIGNAHDNGVASSSTCLFEDNQIEFSKREPSNSKSETSIFVHDHNSSNCKNDTFKKRVTFLDSENLIKRDQGSQSRENSSLNRNCNFPKAVIEKRIHDSDTNDNDSNIVDTNSGDVIEDQFENENKSKADLTEDETRSILQEKTKFMNFFKISDNTNTKSLKNENSFENGCNDSNSYDDIDIYRNFIKNCDSLKLKRKVLEGYLNEATTFMRNINSLNEYVSNNTTVCRGHQRDEKRKRGNHRRFFPSQNLENYEKLEDDLIVSDASDDNLMDESLKKNDTIAPTKSFENCLESLARLENSIRKANNHDRYLREKYNIVVESAGAKSGLANSSIDSSTNSKTAFNLSQGNSLVPLQEFLISSEGTDTFSERTSFKDSSVTRAKEENEDIGDSFRINDEFYDTNNATVCDHGEFEKRNFYRLTNTIPSCHYCYMKNTRIENFYRQRTYYDTCKLYHFHDDNRNSNNLFDDSVATVNESAQLSTSALIKPTKCYERLEKSLGDNGSSRHTMADAFMRCTKSEMSNFINSRSLHRLATGNTKSYSWKRLRYRPESPRAKFLELLRERRRIVESSRDVRS